MSFVITQGLLSPLAVSQGYGVLGAGDVASTADLGIEVALASSAQVISPRTLTSALTISVDMAASAQSISPRTLASALVISVAADQAGAIQNISPVTASAALEIEVSALGATEFTSPHVLATAHTIEVSLNGVITTAPPPYPYEGVIRPRPKNQVQDIDYRPERHII